MKKPSNLQQIQTPCLIVNQSILQNNIAKLHAHLKKLGVQLRPHGKTAKNFEIMQMALKGQFGGITVSTLKEAKYYFDYGIKDIVYAVGIACNKMDEIAAMIKYGANITVILDSIEQATFVTQKAQEHQITIPVLIEIDCDDHRAGIALGDPLLVEIGKFLTSQKGTILSGILTHCGGSYKSQSIADIKNIAKKERDTALACANTLKKAGLSCAVISVGSTPTATFSESFEGITEVRAGVFMFQDLVMAGLGVCDIEDIALSVLTSVIGHQKNKGWIITDSGWTSLSSDRGTANQKIDQGYGLVCDRKGKVIKDMIVSSTNQEHGIIIDRHHQQPNWHDFQIGTLLRILPNHACATASMHDHYVIIDDSENITNTWQRVNGW